jgi:hypothetical protein
MGRFVCVSSSRMVGRGNVGENEQQNFAIMPKF